MKSAREAALLALHEIEYDGKYSNMAVKSALSPEMSGADRGLATTLIYGTVRRKLTLDYVIAACSETKLKKLSPYVLLILRMGVYQLYFLDKIPESAAVNESVKLAKKFCFRSAGFINAVLRAAAKKRGAIAYPNERMKRLSVEYSFPEEIIKILSQYDCCEELLAALNEEPKTTLRINTLKGGEPEIPGARLEKSPLYEYARYLYGCDPAGTKAYREGFYTAQDEAAMMASIALAPRRGDFCIDVCAAPGGKTTHLAELMKNEGKIFAFDLHPHKAELIRKNAQRMGISIIEAKTADASEPIEELFGTADRVLADVPCSGLGIIRRKPDIKWNREDISELPCLQYRILETAAKYLKKGGELVYSTCTLNKSENEDVICEFVRAHREFEFVKIELAGPLARENDGYITLLPNIDHTDGFFIAKIKRCI